MTNKSLIKDRLFCNVTEYSVISAGRACIIIISEIAARQIKDEMKTDEFTG